MCDIPAFISRTNECLMTNQDVQNSAVDMTCVISATYSGRLAKKQSHL